MVVYGGIRGCYMWCGEPLVHGMMWCGTWCGVGHQSMDLFN